MLNHAFWEYQNKDYQSICLSFEKNLIMRIAILLSMMILTACQFQSPEKESQSMEATSEEGAATKPIESFFLERAYPDDKPNLKAYTAALTEAKNAMLQRGQFTGFDEDWIVRGPANIGARVNTIAIHPTDESIMMMGFSGGGVWRTIDGGDHWESVFDEQPFQSIGDIAFDPTDPNTVYVGTGDPNISGYPFIGDGVYKSTDGGTSWTNLGLGEDRIISKIEVSPEDSQTIYVSTMGLPFERTNQRGMYKSTDGGASWEQILFVSNQSGVIDFVLHPENSNIIYAASWDRIRNNNESVVSGPNAKIFKSIDGGENWDELGPATGLPEGEQCRIGLSISEQNPDHVFALYVGTDLHLLNIFKTEDAGDNWSPIIDWDNETNGLHGFTLGGFGWYFGKVRVNPQNENDILFLGIDLWRTLDGGQNWYMASPPWFEYTVHADKHDLHFLNNGDIILGTDGGSYKLDAQTQEWEDIENIPTTQFYRVAYNPHQPDWYYGGAQDNGTTGGPDLETEWPRIYGGDGFQTVFHPDFPEIFFAQSQNGNIVVTYDGGQSWSSADSGINSNGDEGVNWDAPYFLSVHDNTTMYTGTDRVYQSIDLGTSWSPISGDLTDVDPISTRNHNISALNESPITQGLVYVGTADGNVHRKSPNGIWANITSGLPDRYISDVKASPTFEDVVFVAHTGYKDNENTPHLFRSENRGDTWESISGDLPDLAINDIYILPEHQDSVLFVATDGGVYGSMNNGVNWERLGANMPMIAVYDMEWNVERNELVAGTFARSIMSYPLDSLFVEEDVISSTDELEAFVPLSLNIFPNPASDFVNISAEIPNFSSATIHLLNSAGTEVRQIRTNLLPAQLSLKDLPQGQYFVRLNSGKYMATGKIIKK